MPNLTGTMSSFISIPDPNAKTQEQRIAAAKKQADEIWKNKIQEPLEQGRSVGLIYSANNNQALAIYGGYNKQTAPEISGGGQALVFAEIAKKINALPPDKQGKVHILPVATSMSGGSDLTLGNAVSKDELDRDLGNIIKHRAANWDILGFQYQNEGQYAIGGMNSPGFHLQGNFFDETNKTRGQYVNEVLTKIKDAKSTEELSKIMPVKNEYRYKDTDRMHLFSAKPGSGLEEEYKDLRGDILKTRILENFKNKINDINSTEKLTELEGEFKNSPEYAILKKGQGLFTKITGIKTSSIKEVEDMIQQKRNILQNIERPGLN